MFLIGITGPKYSGKDTVAQMLVEDYQFNQIRLADPIHEFVNKLGFPLHFKKEEYRPIMVTMGMQSRKVWEDVFIQCAEKRMRKIIKDYVTKYNLDANPKIVVSDIRFNNEWNWVRKHHGVIWRVEGRTEIDTNDPAEIGISQHYKPDIIIDNTGTKEQLDTMIAGAYDTTAEAIRCWEK